MVSLLTTPEPKDALASFYGRLQIPCDTEESKTVHDERTVAEQGRQLILVNLFRLREAAASVALSRAYRTDLRGFAIGWAICGGLILLAWAVLRL